MENTIGLFGIKMTFKNIINALIDEQSVENNHGVISQEDYDKFCREYVFDALKGKSFGAAFCAKFNVVDFLLLRDQPDDWAKDYIKNCGYVREK